MTVEHDVIQLKEIQVRVQSLLTYYRALGEQDRPCVHELEDRLQGVAAALRTSTVVHRC